MFPSSINFCKSIIKISGLEVAIAQAAFPAKQTCDQRDSSGRGGMVPNTSMATPRLGPRAAGAQLQRTPHCVPCRPPTPMQPGQGSRPQGAGFPSNLCEAELAPRGVTVPAQCPLVNKYWETNAAERPWPSPPSVWASGLKSIEPGFK